MRGTLEERFWAKVRKTDGCWEWTGSGWPTGYGAFSVGRSMKYAHRVAYELAHGAIPKGLDVCHRCDNRKCVRPDHLFVGTRLDNVRDAVAKGRHAHGDTSGSRKISSADAKEIAAQRAAGTPCAVLAKRYGLHPNHVGRIGLGVSWRIP